MIDDFSPRTILLSIHPSIYLSPLLQKSIQKRKRFHLKNETIYQRNSFICKSPLRIEFHMLLAVWSEWWNQARTLPIKLYIFDQNFIKFNEKWDATAKDGPLLVHKREINNDLSVSVYEYMYRNEYEKKCNAHKRRV